MLSKPFYFSTSFLGLYRCLLIWLPHWYFSLGALSLQYFPFLLWCNLPIHFLLTFFYLPFKLSLFGICCFSFLISTCLFLFEVLFFAFSFIFSFIIISFYCPLRALSLTLHCIMSVNLPFSVNIYFLVVSSLQCFSSFSWNYSTRPLVVIKYLLHPFWILHFRSYRIFCKFSFCPKFSPLVLSFYSRLLLNNSALVFLLPPFSIPLESSVLAFIVVYL